MHTRDRWPGGGGGSGRAGGGVLRGGAAAQGVPGRDGAAPGRALPLVPAGQPAAGGQQVLRALRGPALAPGCPLDPPSRSPLSLGHPTPPHPTPDTQATQACQLALLALGMFAQIMRPPCHLCPKLVHGDQRTPVMLREREGGRGRVQGSGCARRVGPQCGCPWWRSWPGWWTLTQQARTPPPPPPPPSPTPTTTYTRTSSAISHLIKPPSQTQKVRTDERPIPSQTCCLIMYSFFSGNTHVLGSKFRILKVMRENLNHVSCFLFTVFAGV